MKRIIVAIVLLLSLSVGLFASDAPFKLYLSTYYDAYYNTYNKKLKIVSTTDNLVINNVVVNRGQCKPYNVPKGYTVKDFLYRIGINPMSYGKWYRFIYSGDCDILEIEVDTNKGNFVFHTE